MLAPLFYYCFFFYFYYNYFLKRSAEGSQQRSANVGTDYAKVQDRHFQLRKKQSKSQKTKDLYNKENPEWAPQKEPI